jgi:hypothetical protein
MAYEFADEDRQEEIPTTPDFLHLKAERIYQVVPFEPLFIRHYSVIEDPKTWQLGIDTNDSLPDDVNSGFGDGPEPIGLMRVESVDDAVRGYVVDLRYARRFVQRPLDFDYTIYKDEDPNTLHKTVPVLAAIFHDPEREQLRLITKHGDALKGFAIGLMQFVDVERAKRGASVWAHTTPSPLETEKKSPGTALNAQFSSPPAEAKPNDDQSVTIDGE